MIRLLVADDSPEMYELYTSGSKNIPARKSADRR
jgi:hypothetical protein